jgi:hypothetical protein
MAIMLFISIIWNPNAKPTTLFEHKLGNELLKWKSIN